jgi:hypothetical protein
MFTSAIHVGSAYTQVLSITTLFGCARSRLITIAIHIGCAHNALLATSIVSGYAHRRLSTITSEAGCAQIQLHTTAIVSGCAHDITLPTMFKPGRTRNLWRESLRGVNARIVVRR